MVSDLAANVPSSVPLVLYHADCADGAGAAFAAWCSLGERAAYRAVRHGDPAPSDDEVRERVVYVLDFSYAWEDLCQIAKACRELHVIDHHKTFLESIPEHPHVNVREGRVLLTDRPFHVVFDIYRSGATLAWRHFHDGEDPPEVLRYVEDRDLWKWELEGSREISAALAARGLREDFHVLSEMLLGVRPGHPRYADAGPVSAADLDRRWDPLRPAKNAGPDWNLKGRLIREGEVLLRAQDQQVRYVADLAERVELRYGESTVSCLAACSPALQSEVGHALAERSRDLGLAPVGIAWFRDGRSGCYRVSLRSVDGYDVSGIVVAHGGGGHRAAAGFQCGELPWRGPA